jgi:hypothetical protein
MTALSYVSKSWSYEERNSGHTTPRYLAMEVAAGASGIVG